MSFVSPRPSMFPEAKPAIQEYFKQMKLKHSTLFYGNHGLHTIVMKLKPEEYSGLGHVSRKPRKRSGPVKTFLVHQYLKTKKCTRLKRVVGREPLFILRIYRKQFGTICWLLRSKLHFVSFRAVRQALNNYRLAVCFVFCFVLFFNPQSSFFRLNHLTRVRKKGSIQFLALRQ